MDFEVYAERISRYIEGKYSGGFGSRENQI